jgi:hypothetical protein
MNISTTIDVKLWKGGGSLPLNGDSRWRPSLPFIPGSIIDIPGAVEITTFPFSLSPRCNDFTIGPDYDIGQL